MVIRGANYRSDSWTLRLFNLIAALKRCLADGSAITIGKECLRRCLEFVCLAVDMHKKTWYKRKTGKNKQTKKNNPEAFHAAVPCLRVTIEMKLFKFLSPSSACSHQSVAAK